MVDRSICLLGQLAVRIAQSHGVQSSAFPREVANGNDYNFVQQSKAQLVLTQQILAWNNGNHGDGEMRMLIKKSRRGGDNSVTVGTSYQRSDLKICLINEENHIALGFYLNTHWHFTPLWYYQPNKTELH